MLSEVIFESGKGNTVTEFIPIKILYSITFPHKIVSLIFFERVKFNLIIKKKKKQ